MKMKIKKLVDLIRWETKSRRSAVTGTETRSSIEEEGKKS